jgi:hypothetical protein
MSDLLDMTGTDPATSNELAEIVIDVHREVFGAEAYVDFLLRFGIAHAVQRAGFVRIDALSQANARIRELEDKLWTAQRTFHAHDELEPEDG